MDIPPRVSPTHHSQPIPMDTTFTPLLEDLAQPLSPTSPLEFNPSQPQSPPFPKEFLNPLDYVHMHGATCLCCINTRNEIQALHEELNFMFSYIKQHITTSSAPSSNPTI